jgi:hypothetical protein
LAEDAPGCARVAALLGRDPAVERNVDGHQKRLRSSEEVEELRRG